MQNSVSAYLITLIRKIKDNSRIDLVVERLSSRLVVEVDANSRFRFRGQLGSAKSGANLALSRADHQFLNFRRISQFYHSKRGDIVSACAPTRRHSDTIKLTMSGHVDEDFQDEVLATLLRITGLRAPQAY